MAKDGPLKEAMCVYSMIADHYLDKWTQPQPVQPQQPIPQYLITQEEIDEFRRLLERAREYDKKMNQPDCENEEKKKKLKELAKAMGFDIDFL